jgi:predicted RNA-binding Zn-ribbon protein involved in translation (DUF1610 family)
MTPEIIETKALSINRSAELERYQPIMKIEEAIQRRQMIIEVVRTLMEKDEDYGTIPGTQKPSLLLPGAQKLDNLFGLRPMYEVVTEELDWMGERHGGEPFFHYTVRCRLLRGDFEMGEALGECNSFESKYRWRKAERLCPECGKETIRRSKKRQDGSGGDGWYCWSKIGGCGAQFKDGTAPANAINSQENGRVPNPDIFDQVNTILKMAEKRAHLSATRDTTAAGQFTVDLEMSPPREDAPPPPPQRAAPPVQQQAPPPPPPPTDPNRPWNTFNGMCAAFAAIKDALKPYTGPYYEKLKKYGVEHANDFSPARLGNLLQMPVSAAQAAQKASDCYRELLAVVADYEAMKSQPTPLDEHLAQEDDDGK